MLHKYNLITLSRIKIFLSSQIASQLLHNDGTAGASKKIVILK